VPEEAIVVACVASLTKHKGLTYLLEALHRVRARDWPVFVLLAGAGPEQAELERKARALALTPVVRFLGQRSDIPLILAASDVAVLPSLREGLSLALLEAGAAGRPSIASRVGGIPEVVQDGVTGILVPPADPGALATALLELVRSPALRADMGRRARRHVEARFAVQAIATEWQALYDSLLRATPSPVCAPSGAGPD
jgi:glycosyltransferase involved in cell wall biosynthesis